MYKVIITKTKIVHEFKDRMMAKEFANDLRKQGIWCFLQYPK